MIKARQPGLRLLCFTASLLVFCSIASAAEPAPPPAHAEKLEDAQDLLEQGNYKDAVKLFREADKIAGGSCVECDLGLAKTFNKLTAYKDALKHVDEVLRQTTEPGYLVQAYNEQGLALSSMAGDDVKQLEGAEKAFRKAHELSGGKSNAIRYNLGYTLLRLSRDAEGIALLKEYLQRDPHAASAEQAKDLIANPVRARKRLFPDFDFVTLAGEYMSSEDLKGKVLLVDFWGTWCAPCVAAIPSLRSMSRRMEKDPFVLLSISNDGDEAALRSFVAEHKMSWPQVWDERREFTSKCSINRFPTYLLVSHEGEILYMNSGWGEQIERDLNTRIVTAIRAARRSAGSNK
jgi:thiol-disulfide isomerase/thioredoxin